MNVPNAGVEWWYAATYQNIITTLKSYSSNATNTSGPQLLTAVPATSAFNITEVMGDFAYTETVYWDRGYNQSVTEYDPYTVTPSATSTLVITREAVLPIPQPGIIAKSDVNNYSIDPPPASVAVTGPAGTVFVATSASPFVYFSAYEVETQVPITARDGKVACRAFRYTYNLSSPYAYVYDGRDELESLSVATGDVPTDFVRQIRQSSCSVGTWRAEVTVIVVVDLVYEVQQYYTPYIVHIESSVLGFSNAAVPSTTVSVENPTEHLESSIRQTQTSPLRGAPFIQPTVSKDTSEVNGAHTEATASTDESAPTTAPGFAHIESTVGTGVAVGITVEANSVGLATGWAGIFSQLHSFMTAFAHLEQTATEMGPSAAAITSAPGPNTGAGPSAQDGQTAQAEVSGAPMASILPQVTGVAGSEPPPPPVLTIGSTTLTANAATQYFVGPGKTLTPGGAVTVSGTVISLAPSASFLVIGGSTLVLPTASSTAVLAVTAPPEIVIAGTTFTANSESTFVIGGQTLAPGSVITVSGTTISLGPSATNVVINGHTEPLIQPITAAPLLTVGNTIYTANPGSSYVVAGQTLTPGGTIVIAGTTIALGPSASFAVINGATETLSGPAALTTPPPLTIGNGVYTAIPGTGTTYLIGGSVLTPGGIITVAGTTISLAPGATAVIVNGITSELLPTATITNAPLLTIGMATYTALSGTGTTFVIGGQTLTPGGIITVSGTTISLSPSATALVFDSGSGTTTETLFPATTIPTTVKTTDTVAGSASAGATPTGATKPSHGAAADARPSADIISILMLAFGISLGSI